MKYHWHWFDGATDCEPPEPGKEWIAVLDEDENEICILALRTDASIFVDNAALLAAARDDTAKRADEIIFALNAVNPDPHETPRLLGCPNCGGFEFERRGDLRCYIETKVWITADGERRIDEGSWQAPIETLDLDEHDLYCLACDIEYDSAHDLDLFTILDEPA